MNPAQPIRLARRLGVYDAALIVMGGIIGSGIFRNPSVVAQRVPSPALMYAVWACGGVVAILGAFIFAELAARRPHDGGLYAYMRDAFHPVVAFMYGWTLLLVSQSGGAAASAITFAGYLQRLGGWYPGEKIVAVSTLLFLTIVNCLGVRAGSNVQNVLMLLKIGALLLLIGVGIFVPGSHAPVSASPFSSNWSALGGMGVAMIPVLFAYSGWQTSSFMTGELKNPTRTLSRGILWGVSGVIVLYMLVNYVCIHVLGVAGLKATDTPAAAVLQHAWGPSGAKIIAAAIMLSTFGFMSNQILTAPRVYHAMAEDGTFFRFVSWLDPRTRAPVIAVLLQGGFAIAIALTGRYDQILNYVTSVDYVFFVLSAIALFIFRARDARTGAAQPSFRVPGHPVTTMLFLLIAAGVVLDTYVTFPSNSLIGLGILLLAVPIYYAFLHRAPFMPPIRRE
ncbi:MAG TPA: amino acid permease [Candidatus Baltobacteraceae bacterium]|jgi:APA family basic amino acid/polyamine antiporter|nr:amino acid permease [Candidatus Baltobacteraceae bacterium]